MNERLLQRFRQLVSAHLGFQKRVCHQEIFRHKIEARIKALHLSPEAYYQLLAEENRTPEWQALIHLIAIRESYFFRDQGQFALLREQILPELIARGRATRSLRIWSAGCSTGEEAYSLAILVSELLPDWRDWNLWIVGTDVSQWAIAQAQQGVYDDWSFRWVEPALQQRYFRQHLGRWEVDPAIRDSVTFQTNNLVQDLIPQPERGLDQIDLILCRNVFIYFEASAIAQVLQKFSDVLNPGGYLITGHTELHGQCSKPLRTLVLPGSVVYQRPLEQSDRPLPEPVLFPLIGDSAIDSVVAVAVQVPTLEQIKVHVEAGDYREAIAQAQQRIALHPSQETAYELMAQAHANLGHYEQAELACQKAIALNALATTPHYLLSQIAEEQGRLEDAKQFLKKIIYIMPSLVPAYLRLADLYEQEENSAKARKMRTAALDLLQQIPADTPIEWTDLTAAELLDLVKPT